jgi:hypothetical protein
MKMEAKLFSETAPLPITLRYIPEEPNVYNSSLSMYYKKTPWPEYASELYWPSDRLFSVKSLQTFADRVCHVVSVTDPYGRILGFLDRSRYFFFQVAPQLYSRGWVSAVISSMNQ